MAIVRVSAGVFIRTECVGKVLQTQYVESSVRKTQTDIYDTSGQHVLWSKCTLVPVGDTPADHQASQRDDHGHDEIMKALREERDATPFNGA